MENKTLLLIWICIDLFLLIGCLFVSSYWINITSQLRDPCGDCIRNKKPEIAECFNLIPANEINLTEILRED